MVRRPRVEYEGCVFHVIQRGNNREFIFKDDLDKGYFINQLGKLKLVMDFKVYGFVLMDNHYHLILRTWSDPLRTIMHRINYKYSRYFNKRYERTGHVFGGRYKAIPVYDEGYLLSLLRYIHQNPVRAGLCQRIEEHRWSSDFFYRTNNNDFVDINFILEMLSRDIQTAIKKYKTFMASEETENYEDGRTIGEIKQETVCVTATTGKEKKSLDEILRETGVSEGEFQSIKSGSRNRNLTPYKLAYIKKAIELQYTLESIGANIKVSGVAILDLLRRNNLIS